VDRLRAIILVHHAQVERERLRQTIARQDRMAMIAKLGGIKKALSMLENDIDKETDGLMNQIEAASVKTSAVFKETRAKVDARVANVHGQLKEVHEFLDGLEKTNGGPTMGDSQESSANSGHEGEPGASWAGKSQT
jgi:hypothetical protein